MREEGSRVRDLKTEGAMSQEMQMIYKSWKRQGSTFSPDAEGWWREAKKAGDTAGLGVGDG